MTAKARSRIILSLFGLVLIVALSILVGVKAIEGFADCSDTLLNSIESPDRGRKAFVYERGCNATAPDTVQINIQPGGTSFDGQKYPGFFIAERAPGIRLQWNGPDSLVVRAEASALKVYRQENRVGDLQITYKLPTP